MTNNVEVIAEIANAHQGDPKTAYELAYQAAKAGADSVKYQIYFGDELLTEDHPRYTHFCNQAFSEETWVDLIEKTRALGIKIYADVFGTKAFNIAIDSNIDGIKIHSSDLINFHLLEKAAQYNKKVFLAVGGSTMLEIKYALDCLDMYETSKEVILLHGFQAYPTEVQDSRLHRIKSLMSIFADKVNYGYMDHVEADDDFSLIAPLLTLPLGVTYIEKHITLDRAAKGVDYYSSIEPHEFRRFVVYVRQAESAFSGESLDFSDSENEYRRTVKKSWILDTALNKGETIAAKHLTMKRSPVEDAPVYIERLSGRKSTANLEKGEAVSQEKVERNVLAIIVARTLSTRLPNKALLEINDEATIIHLIKRVLLAKEKGYVNEIAFCTTVDPSDDELASVISQYPVDVYRGEIDDVLARMMGPIMEKDHCDVALRITGDDILVDPDYIKKTVDHHLQQSSNYTDAKRLATGTEVEVFDTDTLRQIYTLSEDSSGTEYLTNYIVDNKHQFNTTSLPVENKHISDARLTLDTKEDYHVIKSLLEHLSSKNMRYDYGMDDIVAFINDNDELFKSNKSIIQKQKPLKISSNLDWTTLSRAPLITIYITHNGCESHLKKSIQSVLSQSFTNFELIIVDDNPTETSRSIIKSFKKYPKVKSLTQNNEGLNTARINVLKLAKGKYLLRLNASDYLNDNALLVLSNKIESNQKLSLVCSDYYQIDQDEKRALSDQHHNFDKSVASSSYFMGKFCSLIKVDTLKEINASSSEIYNQNEEKLFAEISKNFGVDSVNLPLLYCRQYKNT